MVPSPREPWTATSSLILPIKMHHWMCPESRYPPGKVGFDLGGGQKTWYFSEFWARRPKRLHDQQSRARCNLCIRPPWSPLPRALSLARRTLSVLELEPKRRGVSPGKRLGTLFFFHKPIGKWTRPRVLQPVASPEVDQGPSRAKPCTRLESFDRASVTPGRGTWGASGGGKTHIKE